MSAPRWTCAVRAALWIVALACIPSRVAAEQGVEQICDPENPSCVPAEAEPEASSDEERDEAPPPGRLLPVTPVSASAPQRALFQLEWGSSLALDTCFERDTEEDILELGSALDAQLSHELSETTRVSVRAELRHWIGARRALFTSTRAPIDSRAAIDLRLGESYWLKRASRRTLRVGLLRTQWGSTTLIRPAQITNPIDQRAFGFVGPARRDGVLAQPAVELSWARPEALGVELLLVPFFVPDQRVIFGRDIALLQPNNPLSASFPVVGLLEQIVDPSAYEQAQTLVTSSSYPDEDLSTPSFGARLTRTRWHADFGLGYFFGWDRTPYVTIDEDVAALARLVLSDEAFLKDFDVVRLAVEHPELLMLNESIAQKRERGEVLLETSFRRRHTMVLDVARYVGPIGVRAEGTFSPQQTFLTTGLGSVRRPAWFGALGLSYERLLEGEGALLLTSEAFALKPMAHDAALTKALVTEDERGVISDQIAIVGEALYGVAAAASFRAPRRGVRLNLGGVFNLSTRDRIAQLSARYALSSSLGVSLGGALYHGPEPDRALTLGGLFEDNDQLFIGLDGAL